jgi:D-inositol-3-phosphate glycosyltransferase
MKRIAMISYHTCPLASQEGKESGGMNVYVLEIGKALAALGVTVDVFTRSQEEDNIPIVDVVPGFRVIHLVAGPQSHISKKELLPYIDSFARSIHDYYASEGCVPDIIHAHYYLSGLIGTNLQKMFAQRIPLTVSFHTLSLMKNLVARDEAEKEDRTRIDAELSLCEMADHLIATSPSDKEYLTYLYDATGDKISVIAPGVNPAVFHPIERSDAMNHIQIPPDQRMILFVGRIEPLKGIDMLLYAIKIVKKRQICL